MKKILLTLFAGLMFSPLKATNMDDLFVNMNDLPGGGIAWHEVNPESQDTILFIHGNSMSSKAFQKQFADDRFTQRLMAVNLPGHGESDDAQNPQDTYSFAGYGKALTAFMDDLRIEKYVICGLSLGGHVAIEMATLNPEKVVGLFLTGTPPIDMTPEGFMKGFNPFEGAELMSFGEKFTKAQAEKFTQMGGFDLTEAGDLVKAAMRTDGKARSLMIANAFSGNARSQKEQIEAFNIPVAFVGGLKDEGIRWDYIKSLQYKNLQGFHTLDCGHVTMWSKSQEFNDLLLDFAQKVFN